MGEEAVKIKSLMKTGQKILLLINSVLSVQPRKSPREKSLSLRRNDTFFQQMMLG